MRVHVVKKSKGSEVEYNYLKVTFDSSLTLKKVYLIFAFILPFLIQFKNINTNKTSQKA